MVDVLAHFAYFEDHKKLGLKCRSMTWPTGGPPKINYGNNHSEKKWVNLLQPLYPDDTGKMKYGKSWALPRIMEKKGSDHAWEILNPYEENLIMERNGDRRPLSKLDIFFPIYNSVRCHI